MWTRPGRRLVVVVLLAVLAGCGGGGSQPITFDTGPVPTFPSTTSAPFVSIPLTTSPSGPVVATTSPQVTTATVAPPTTVAVAAQWIDVTGDLTGLSSECGTVSFVTASPVADLVIAGVGLQGLWLADADDRWTPTGSGSGSDVVDNRPFSLLFDPKDAQTFWEAGGYHGSGVYRTSDGGATYRRLGDLFHIQAIGVDMSDPARATLVASSHEQAGLFSSSDGGAHWTDLTDHLPPIGYIMGLTVVDRDTFVIGSSAVNGVDSTDGVFRSTDGGRTWESVFDGAVLGSPLVSAIDGSMYWILDGSRGVIRSTDDGATWERVNAGAVLFPGVQNLVEMPDGALVGVGRFGLVRSPDHGTTWQSFGPNLPFSDAVSVAYAPLRQAFYVARHDCDVSLQRQPVTAGSVVRLDVIGTT